jgi:DNA-binding transcriptional ArsR family regulator
LTASGRTDEQGGLVKKSKAKEAAQLAKALSHPIRIEILEAIGGDGASPVQLSRDLDEPLGTVSYHVSNLKKLGCLKLLDSIPRRGAVEHVYGLTDRAKALRTMLESL